MTGWTKRLLYNFFCLGFLILLLCSEQVLAEKEGGTLKIGLEKRIYGFDTVISGPASHAPTLMMLESLFFQNPETGEVEPMLGLSMKQADNRMSWSIELRRGVRFHDGTPFNAEAVAAHYNRILDPKNGARYRGYLTSVETVEARSEYTAVFHLKNPWAAFPAVITGTGTVSYIHSPTAVKKQGKNNTRHPVGTGKFMFKEWVTGDRVVMERNPDYWGKKANVDRVVFKLLPDAESRFASLLADDVDVIWTDRPSHVFSARKRDDLVVVSNPGEGAMTILLNTEQPPLDDWRVRKALQLAFDNEAFIRATHKGLNEAVYHPFGRKFDCPGFKHPGPDLDKAKALLQDYGKAVEVAFQHSSTSRGRDIAQVAQFMWNKIGVKTELKPMDQTTLVRNVVKRNYMLSGWRMVDEIDPYLDNQMVASFLSDSGANYTNYKNKEMDQLLLAGRQETDNKIRSAIYCEIAKLITKDVPILYRGEDTPHMIHHKDVKGIFLNTSGRLVAKDAWLDR